MLSITNLKSLAFILIIIIVIFSVILFGTSQTGQPQPSISPISSMSPTSFPNLAPPSISPQASINTTYNQYSEQYLEEQEKINEQEQPVIDQALTVSAFVDKLPYKGQFITVTYNIYNNQIYLEYDKAQKEQSLNEFADLLKRNDISNINWLYNLNIIEK